LTHLIQEHRIAGLDFGRDTSQNSPTILVTDLFGLKRLREVEVPRMCLKQPEVFHTGRVEVPKLNSNYATPGDGGLATSTVSADTESYVLAG
jgi:hypothetical protein